ncbi:hypothetical protein [Shewanella algae]|uniref:hypothetical protein n=1 Tax=Shewanella algae TaxID=38313 RepID=UPI0031F5BC29
MINRLVNTALKLLISWVVLCPLAVAFTLNLDVRDNQVIALNAMQTSTGATLTDWDAVPGLAPAKKWFPVLTPISTTLTLVNPTKGVTISVTVDITGLEFQFPAGFISTSNPWVQGQVCDESFAKGSTITLSTSFLSTGNECSSELILTTKSNAGETPFLFSRPIFNLSKIKNEILGKKIPKGNYNGFISYPLKYFYFNDSGVFSYRVFNKSFGINLNYRPDYIESITMPALTTINPNYNTQAQQASGSAIIPVTANGYFEYGLKMHLEDRAYMLKNTNGRSIPYSLNCNTCNVQSLISRGKLMQTTFEHSRGSSDDFVRFDLEVFFQNVSVEDIDSGLYRDELTIYFEVDY